MTKPVSISSQGIPMAYEAVVNRIVRAARRAAGVAQGGALERESIAATLERLRAIAADDLECRIRFARQALPDGFRPAAPAGSAAARFEARAGLVGRLEDAVLVVALGDAIAQLAEELRRPTAISGASPVPEEA